MTSDWMIDGRLPILDQSLINFDFDLDSYRDNFDCQKLDNFYEADLPTLSDGPTLAALNLVEDKFDPNDFSEYLGPLTGEVDPLDSLDKGAYTGITTYSTPSTSHVDSIQSITPSTSFSPSTLLGKKVRPLVFW